MGNIIENKEVVYDWDSEKIYLIEEDDYVEGGEDGVSNRQAKQLTSRTRDLFNRVVEILRKITKGDTDTLNTAKNYTDTKIASVLDTAPETLNTLNELAAALGDDPNFATTVATQIGTKVDRSDSRLSDARPASDVHPWAKDPAKPSYSAGEVGAITSTLNNRVVDDCNKYTQNGMYGFSDKPTNGPGPAYLSMLVVKNIETGYQLAGGYNSGKLFFRGMVTDVSFSDWCEIFHSGNFDPATKVSISDPRLTDARPANGGAANLLNWHDISGFVYEDHYLVAIRSNPQNANTKLYLRSPAGDHDKIEVAYATNAGAAANATRAASAEVADSLRDFNPDTKADTSDVMKVLIAGSVNANGSKGKFKGWFSSELLGSRTYKVTHNLGHTNYMTFATCVHPNQVHDISVISETANYTEFLIGGTSGTSFASFNFTIFEIM